MRGYFVVPGLAVILLWCVSGRSPADDAEAVAHDEKTLKDAKLDSDGPTLLEFFRKRTIDSNDLALIKKLIVDLGDESFEVQQNPTAQSTAIGAPAVSLLTQAIKAPDIEVVRRAEACLKQIEAGSS